MPSPFTDINGSITFNLNQADFTTAVNLVNTINAIFGANTAVAIDSTSIRVMGPIDPDQKVAFVAALENLEVERGEAIAKVIINSRTGTVVIGSHVQVDEAAVAHGSLTVTISEETFVSQPGPFSRGGDTAVVADSSVFIEEEDNRMFLFQPGVSLNDLVRAVNQVGASPSDLVAILEALQQVGALRARLVVI